MISIIRTVAIMFTVGGVAVGALVATGVISMDQVKQPLRAVGLYQPAEEPSAAGTGGDKPAALANVEPQGEAKTESAAPATVTEKLTKELTGEAPKAGDKPSFDVVRVEPNGDAVVAGAAEPGAIVALMADGQVVGKGVANASGQWAIVVDKPFEPGSHDVSVKAKPAAGGDEVESEQRVTVSIPEEKSGEALVVMNTPDQPTTVLQKPEDATVAAAEAKTGTSTEAPAEQPKETVVATAEPAAQESAEASQAATTDEAPSRSLTPAGNNGTTSEPAAAEAPAEPAMKVVKNVTVEAVESENDVLYAAGGGEPGSTVRVYVDDQFTGEATVNGEGRWLLKTDRPLAAGRYTVRADQLGGSDGAVVARAAVPFERGADEIILRRVVATSGGSGDAGGSAADVVLDELPSVIIRPGDNLWRISRRLYGQGVRYTTIYQANKTQIGNPDLIYPGQVFLTPSGDTNWTN